MPYLKKRTFLKGTGVIIFGLILIILSIGLSIAYGAADIKFATVWEAVLHFNPDVTSHQIIQEIRLPRAIGAVMVGALLAVSGAVMQGLTRNPLASPSIMGVTDGAAFALVITLAFFPAATLLSLTFSSFVGAGLGVMLVFMIGAYSKGGLTPVKLALAGVAVGAMLSAFSSAIALHFQVAKDMSFWYAGGLTSMNWGSVKILLVAGGLGLLLSMYISRSITILSLGEEVSKGLGQNTLLVKLLGVIVVLVLTGAAVSVAGAIGFIGLVIPHITRFIIGSDYRWIIPISAVLGGLLLVLADIAARMVNAPFETPVGAITAIIGVPFFLYLARGERRGF
ncbi:FecCD family ABC transporter permease [Neobacillus sp. NRS-1170]|uniref:FecCD family ABC transporter permease n=1 Tax=Neobacillus sp. NRS-1170 TaxID=3233898 RepID=UPI003D2918BE